MIFSTRGCNLKLDGMVVRPSASALRSASGNVVSVAFVPLGLVVLAPVDRERRLEVRENRLVGVVAPSRAWR